MSDNKLDRSHIPSDLKLDQRTCAGTWNKGAQWSKRPEWPQNFQLMQLRRSVDFAGDPVSEQCMDELAREMANLKPRDPRRVR
jgi:hypothetical protein